MRLPYTKQSQLDAGTNWRSTGRLLFVLRAVQVVPHERGGPTAAATYTEIRWASHKTLVVTPLRRKCCCSDWPVRRTATPTQCRGVMRHSSYPPSLSDPWGITKYAFRSRSRRSRWLGGGYHFTVAVGAGSATPGRFPATPYGSSFRPANCCASLDQRQRHVSR